MGFRYRKSINLGGGFRVNFSKSGIGYSWGVKGYRVTKKAGGGTRKTYSIPGTGLSWTEDSGSKKKRTSDSNRLFGRNGTSQYTAQNTESIVYKAEDADVKQLVTENTREFLDAIKKYSRIRMALSWGCGLALVLAVSTPVLWLAFIVGIAGLIYLTATKRINVEYEFDDYGKQRILMMDRAMGLLSNNKCIWQVNTIQANSSVKTNAGAGQSVGRKIVKFLKKKPYFLKTDATCYYVKLAHDQIYILPDRLIVKGKKGWGAVDYSELHMDVGDVTFIESGAVPRDAQIIGHTWQFVNKNGSPDKRFKNNKQLSKCHYGELRFVSNTGLNVILYISNIDNARQFTEIVKTMIKDAEQAKLLSATEVINPNGVESNASDNETVNGWQKNEMGEKSVEVLHVAAANKELQCVENTNDTCFSDMSDKEQRLIETFLNKLDESNVLRGECDFKKSQDGTIEIIYKKARVGQVNMTSANEWLEYPIGNSGKSKRIEGSGDELMEKTSNWLRYIINYM